MKAVKKMRLNSEELTDKRDITLSMSRKHLIDSLVELCTVNGRPLCIVEDSGMKKLITPLANALGVTINQPNLKDFISEAANEIRADLRKTLSGKIFYLKADSATRLHRSILGVNCQFYCSHKKKLRIATLASGHDRSENVFDS
jgi:hypothetical protein